MASKTKIYQAYLLRFWRQDEARPWRVTLQRVGGEQHYHFASVDEALTFIMDQLEGEKAAGQEHCRDPSPGNT